MHSGIRVSHESKRGCGYRKAGGIYLVADGPGRPCGKKPIPLTVCPCCGSGIKPSRGFTWVNATQLLSSAECRAESCRECPLFMPLGRAGLLWVGAAFYPTPDAWNREAQSQGVSRRLSAIPCGFKLGETWIMLAHRNTIQNPDGTTTAGIFHAFKPSRIEIIVTGNESAEAIDRLIERGLSPVKVVPIGQTLPLEMA